MSWIAARLAACPAPPCPDWCTDAPHDWDDMPHDDVTLYRRHEGPDFGPFSGCAEELSSNPGVLGYFVVAHFDGPDTDDLNPSQLLDVATNATAAAQWLESHR